VPPKSGKDGPGGVGDEVTPISGGVGEEVGAGAFGDQAPHDQVQGDFREGGEAVVGAPVEFALNPEDEGQGGGDEQEVVEVILQKRDVDCWLQSPTIDDIAPHRDQAQRVAPVGE